MANAKRGRWLREAALFGSRSLTKISARETSQCLLACFGCVTHKPYSFAASKPSYGTETTTRLGFCSITRGCHTRA
jgi:hypothetical protein